MQNIANLCSSLSLQNAIMENCDDIVTVKSLDMRYISCNRAFLRVLGFENESFVIDKRIDEVLTERNSQIITKNCEIVKKTMESKSFILKIEKEFYSKIIKMTLHPIIQDAVLCGFLSISRDVTQEEGLKLKLIEKIAIINSLLENLPMLAYMKDKNNKYIAGSKHAKKFFVEGIDYYAGNIQIDMHDSEQLMAEEDDYVVTNRETLIKEKVSKSKDGQEHWYKVHKSPILDTNNEVSGMVIIAQNIDAEKQLEAQKELFLATLTHDLKNPLQAQISSLQLLSKGKFGNITDSQREILDIVIESASFMREMLHSILSTYKYENGMVKLNKTSFDINELIHICMEEAKFLAQEKNISIEYINKSDNSILYADESQIRRVIANMLNNSINYAYKNTNINITFFNKTDKFLIKIKNKSEPIPENMKSRIFEKYVAGTNSNIKRGIGLGLYFCKKVIDAHNGNIILNANGMENEFVIELPKVDNGQLVVNFM